MRIFFVNRFFHPDESATSRILTDLVGGLRDNFNIQVVTSRHSYDNSSTRLPVCTVEDRLTVNRLWSSRFGRSKTALRAIDYLSFHAAVAWFLVRRVRPGDVVVLKTDPPLLQLINTALIRIRGGKVVNWLQDIYPEIAERAGVYRGPAWLARMICKWRDRTLRAAVTNVVISERMATYLQGRGIRNVRVIPNWADEQAISPVPREANDVRREWRLGDRFVVMYSGNLGRVHAFDEIREAMHLLSHRDDIAFVFVGGGAEQQGLKAFVESKGLRNTMFFPLQPRDRLRHSLAAADLHLVTLKAGMEDLVMPSKLYGVWAAGRPVAFVGEPDSAVARLIRESGTGLAFTHGDAAGLVQAIEALADEPASRAEQGRNARRLFEQRFTRAHCLGLWQDLIQGKFSAETVPGTT
ncbi:glycosyltransferase family 4 protein [Elongatibacter sediminis]|uniref:Glycosyltransferase family 4 protein n=1 Tax=Elongatibacter sediminis TaxID=3119006 RepID=A0AAW9RDK9_9GAMM